MIINMNIERDSMLIMVEPHDFLRFWGCRYGEGLFHFRAFVLLNIPRRAER